MGKILDFLSHEWVDEQLASRHGRARAASSRAKRDVQKVATKRLLRSLGDTAEEATWGCELREGINRCELEYAYGSPPTAIRQVCHQLAERFRPVVQRMDFSEQQVNVDSGMRPSAAKELAERFGGRWWKADGQYAGVEYACIQQPFRLEMPNLWMIAAVSGDRALAKSVSASYQVYAPAQLVARGEVREIMLRHALAEDREGEAALAGKLEPGYSADFPPQLIEFPLGVVRGDAEMVLKGVHKLGTTMKGKWNVNKHRIWYDKQVARYGTSGWRSPGTWEDCVDKTKHSLFDLHWVFSWWAVAWLNIARWRGMDAVFRKPEAFSEWVPVSLCLTN